MDKSIYCISGYIPSDENKVVMNVYKMIGIGDKETRKWCWATISGDSGIGFGLKFGEAFYDSELLALLGFLKIVNEDYQKIDEMNFEEVMVCYNEMKDKIAKNLKPETNGL